MLNNKPNSIQYMDFPVPKRYSRQEVEDKLQVLRNRWKVEIDKRPILEQQARLLQVALEKHDTRFPQRKIV